MVYYHQVCYSPVKLVQNCLDNFYNFSEGLSMDWVNNKLYFTDSGLGIVGVFDPVHFYYKVLVRTGQFTQPRAIVLDPNTRYD